MPRPSTQSTTTAFSSQGSALFVEISGVFTEVFEVYGLPDSGGDTPTIDVTTLGSEAEETLNDFPVAPQYDFEMNHRLGDTTHQYLDTLSRSGALNNFKIVCWNGTLTETNAFAGRVKKFARNLQTRSAAKVAVSIKQSGASVVTEA